MKGDFTRRTFRRRHHYRGVLQQQGRVQLDADWNEQVDIDTHVGRMVALDTFGTHGGPSDGAGMAITCVNGDAVKRCPIDDLRISAGRYYVGGTLCENEEPVPLAAQPDLPGVPPPTKDGRYAAYLDVWAEHVTALEQPALREVALGGPDTTTRARTIWQMRLAPVDAIASCADVAPPWAPPNSSSTGRMRARAKAPTGPAQPCVIPPAAGYRRLENQLYRVEIHDAGGIGGTGGATYTWSRDNGSVARRLLTISGNTLTIDAPGRDDKLGFARNIWVEVVDVERVRRGEPGYLGRLDDAVDTELTVAEWRDGVAPTPDDLGNTTIVRRWDSAAAITVATGWVDLEDGVQIQFDAGGQFRTGDYWVIPARTANLQGRPEPDLAGDVEWPRGTDGKPAWQFREGIEHRFAAVALLQLTAGSWALVKDCRRTFAPLGQLIEVGYAGGDGQEAIPGDSLRQPLAVSVANHMAPVAGARIHFSAADPDGRLAATEDELKVSAVSSIDIATEPDGVARCYWRPAADPADPADPARLSQQVTARMLGSAGTGVGPPLDFTARLSIARQVGFAPGSCAPFTGARTVQDALDRLLTARSLVAIGGDGQVGPPGADLPVPVEVLVRSDCGPAQGAMVKFSVGSGAVADSLGGLAAAASVAELITGADGIARCFWRLGGETDRIQALVATLLPGGTAVEQPTRFAFTASLDVGQQHAPGLHVTGVVKVGDQEPLLIDSVVAAEDLAEGVAVLLDGTPVESMVKSKPVLTLTLDLPFPFSTADQELWSTAVVGTLPLTLDGAVGLDTAAQAVVWVPSDGAANFLEGLFETMTKMQRGDRVLCHLTLTGRAIADSLDSDQVVNGLTLARPDLNGVTELAFPSIDDVRGADFTMWFWLMQSVDPLELLTTRGGLFRLKSARDILDLAISRDLLRASVRAGTVVGPHVEPDLDGARRAADQAFRNTANRHLVIVVDERHTDAAGVLRDALAEIEVEVEVIPAADPAAVARARIDANEQLDGVLTDNASTAPIVEIGKFKEAIRL